MTKPSPPAIRAYLGGSFNPVHNAHIEMAMEVYNALIPFANEQQCELQVSLLPNARSPFKQQSTDPKHRLAMLKLAIKDTPLHIDELELWQAPPVYTIDSVQTLRRRYPNDRLIFIMGMDSARSLEQWKQGLELTDYVNLWLFDRSYETEIIADEVKEDIAKSNAPYHEQLTVADIAKLTTQLPAALQQQVTSSLTELLAMPEPSLAGRNSSQQPLKTIFKGRIYIDTRTVKMMSSTEIRQQLFEQIHQQQKQTTSDGSLVIVQNPLSKTLNSAVYHYIIAHQLYSAA